MPISTVPNSDQPFLVWWLPCSGIGFYIRCYYRISHANYCPSAQRSILRGHANKNAERTWCAINIYFIINSSEQFQIRYRSLQRNWISQLTNGLKLQETNVLDNFGASRWADEWAQQRARATRAVQLNLIEWAMQKNELVSESHSILSVIYTPSVMDL